MVLGRIRYFFTKNPLDLLDPDELRADRIRYDADIRNFHARIAALEKEIDSYWGRARETKSSADERAFAERINTLSQTRNSILKKITDTESRLRTVEEFINRIDEKNRKQATDRLTTGYSQMELENLLTKVNTYFEIKHQTDRTLTLITEPAGTEDIDESVSEILQAIKVTKQSETVPAAVAKEEVAGRQKTLETES
jgi:vacuolar-type H+-ATPase subunit I/STV1